MDNARCTAAFFAIPPLYGSVHSITTPLPPCPQVMNINPDDTVLTLTSGGCNALNLLLHGAGEVVSVDCNPAQSALLELKAIAIQELNFEDTWRLFGEGKHSDIERLYEHKLAPYLSQTGHNFWEPRLWYFKEGLYYQGGMVGAWFVKDEHQENHGQGPRCWCWAQNGCTAVLLACGSGLCVFFCALLTWRIQRI